MFNRIKVYAFDLDGTVYTGNEPNTPIILFIQLLQRLNYKVVFHTNNSRQTQEQIHDKLQDMGILCEVNDIYTPIDVIEAYLNKNDLDELFIIGTDDFKKVFRSIGFKLHNSTEAEHIVIGLDPHFSVYNWEIIHNIISKGGQLIVANMDKSYPIGYDVRAVGCGKIAEMICELTNKFIPDFVAGKPSPYIFEQIAKDNEVSVLDVMIIGDSEESDRAAAEVLGCQFLKV